MPGHSRLDGSQMADPLVRQGADTPFMETESFCGIGDGFSP